MPDEAPGPGRPGRAVDEAAAREAEHAARLLGYLRDLARARRRPSRDLAEHDHVHWLAELPGDVYVERDAGPGDVLFSVPVIPLTPPVVLDEFDGWLALRNWYRILRDLSGAEVVLATGLLSWRPAVHDHLLSTPVRIVLDERTERIDVVLTGHTSLCDRELLAGHPGFRPAGWVSDAVQAGQGFGLNASVGDVLRKWCQVALTSPADYREDWTPDTDGASPAPRIRLAPALVVRPQGREAVADHHARLLGLLPRGVPDGLGRFVSGTRRPQVMHVPERAPETVPDLLAGLLARGHRVLVATSGPAASAALRAALPPGLAALTATDPSTAARVADGVRGRGPAPDLGPLTDREEAAARRVAEIAERLRRGAPEEPPPDPGGEDPQLSWMPVRPDMPAGPPITRSEAAELVVLLAEETTERKARTAQRDIDPGALPSAAYVRTLIDAETAAAERAERSKTDLSQRLRDSDVTLLARLDGDASAVGAAFRDLGLDGHPGGWNASDLAVRALGDALAERRPLIWARVVEMTSRAQWAERALAELGGHEIELPADADLRGLAAAAQDLRTYLADGGALKRGPLRSSAQRQAEPLLATVTVDGAAPATPELLDLVHTDLMVRITCRELQYVWEAAGISFPADLAPADRVARFVRAHARLARVRDAMTALDSTRRLLERSGFRIPLAHPIQWHDYAAALRNALEGLGVNRATADLDALRDSIGPVDDDDPPELRAALAAIDARDAAAYGRALGALAEARHERSRQNRCAELIARVRAVHPDLANLMIATDGDEVWHARTRRWDDAWAWARRRAAPPAPADAEERLRAALAAAEDDLHKARADLTAARAWTSAAARATSAPDVVPAWILPLWRIPDVLPPVPEGFDVVIVDGEHEAGAEALYVLWHAPRVILVGPPGPALQPPEGPPPTTLLPAHLHEAVTPTSSLFAALTTAPSPDRPDEAPQEPPASPPRPGAPPPEADRGPRAPERPGGPPARPRALSERPDATQRDVPITPPVPPPPPEGPGALPTRPSVRPSAAPREGAPLTGRDPRPPERPAAPPARPGVPASESRPGGPREAGPGKVPDPRALERPRTPPERPDVTAQDLRVPPRPAEPRDGTPNAPRGASGPSERPDLTQRDLEAPSPPASRPGAPAQGSRGPGQGASLPPRRLDAPRREPREPGPGTPRAPGGGPSLPPRRLDAAGSNARGPETNPGPPAPRSDIPALWGKPGPLPKPPLPPEAPEPPPRPQTTGPSPRPESVGPSPRPQAAGPPSHPETAGPSPRPETAGPPSRPQTAGPPPRAQVGEPSAGQGLVRRGRSIAGYKRPELVEIVGHIAELEPDLTDEQIVELVTRLLGCPEDEALLVGARLRYAVEAYREGTG
ncbi:hypothetical protein [Spirillospora sp. CA-128828]|uniref:hypothetical protein n=1 Tax=Spirillospora sp. CA-128828 TaxID=3240033 RepID=UPI003D90CE38